MGITNHVLTGANVYTSVENLYGILFICLYLIAWEITGTSRKASSVACNEHDMPVRLPYEYGLFMIALFSYLSEKFFGGCGGVFCLFVFVLFCFLYVPGANNDCRGPYLVKVQRIHDCWMPIYKWHIYNTLTNPSKGRNITETAVRAKRRKNCIEYWFPAIILL